MKNVNGLTERRIAIKTLASTAAGRQLIFDILQECELYTIPSRDNVLINLGKREVGLNFLSWLSDAGPDLYPLILAERANARTDKSDDKSDYNPFE